MVTEKLLIAACKCGGINAAIIVLCEPSLTSGSIGWTNSQWVDDFRSGVIKNKLICALCGTATVDMQYLLEEVRVESREALKQRIMKALAPRVELINERRNKAAYN